MQNHHPGGRRIMAALLAASALTLPATALRAQEDADGSKDAPLSAPIVVNTDAIREKADGPVIGNFATQSATATKTGTPLIETPQSVSVISSQDMQARDDQSIGQALRYSTGVTTENRGAVVTRYDMITIRGFQVNRSYLDGLQLQYNGWYAIPQIDPSMLSRVEILKGPASVLYGSTPPGGLVNLVSKRPQEIASGEVSASVGNQNMYSGYVDVTGPLDEDGKYLYRFIGKGWQEDGQAKTTKVERVLFAPSFTWRPTDDTQITFLAHYQRDPKSGGYGAVPARGSVFGNPNGEIPTDFYDGDVNWEAFDRRQWTAGYEFQHSFDDVFTFKQNVRYLRTLVDYKSVYSTSLQSDNRTLNRASIYSDEDSRSIAIDNQLQARFETGALEHTVLAGLDYWTLNSDVEVGYGTAPTLDVFNPNNDQTIPPISPTADYDYTRHQTGVYLQEQMKWGGLVALLGGRQDWYHRQDDNRLGGSPSSLQQNEFSGRAGLLYHFENGFAPYVSYAESFEPQTGVTASGTPLDPSTGQQVEAGVKFQSPDERFMATAAVFEIKKQNIGVDDPDPTAPSNAQIQVGELRSRGFEIEGHLRPIKDLKLSAFYSLTNAEYTKDTTGLVGKTPVWVAKHNGSVWAEYSLPPELVNGLTLGAGARYVGASYVDAANTGKTSPYVLFDAMAEYDLGTLSSKLIGTSLRVNATNLGDRRYVAGCYGQDWCWFGEERRLTLTLTHRW